MYIFKKPVIKKIVKNKSAILLIATAITITGCGTSESDSSNTTVDSPSTTITDKITSESSNNDSTSDDSSLDDLEAIGNTKVEKKLFSVELTIPSGYVGETTQEELDELAKENGYKSIKLNDDGSATYIMTKEQHKEMMNEIASTINTSLQEMIGSEDYPNITDITANDDFTSFTITTKSTELDFAESMSCLLFYSYGGMYNIFNGTSVDNIHLDYINFDSGDIISSSDSNDE